jgi:mRNA interferase MazF
MARFIKGDVVVVPFPFSDLSQSKRRPALVLTELDGDDLILCQITSQLNKDRYAIPLHQSEFQTGSLKQSSFIRPNRLFTADHHIILYAAGHLKKQKMDDVIEKLMGLFKTQSTKA